MNDLPEFDSPASEILDSTAPLEPRTRWPKIIGIISLVYACGGLLCQLGAVASSFLSEFFMRMGGMDARMPAAMKITTVAMASVTLLLGVLMLAGAIALLRRRPAGVSRLRVWAVLRLSMLVLAVIVTVLTMPAQLDFQRQILEAQNRKMREAGRSDLVKPWNEDDKWRQQLIVASVATGISAAYPLFLGFYLSRRTVREEVRHWAWSPLEAGGHADHGAGLLEDGSSA